MELIRLADVVIQNNARRELVKFIKEYRLGKLIMLREDLPKRFKKDTHFSTKTHYISLKDLRNVYHRLAVSRLTETLDGARESIGIFLGEVDIKRVENEIL